jgi:hypothetical protein
VSSRRSTVASLLAAAAALVLGVVMGVGPMADVGLRQRNDEITALRARTGQLQHRVGVQAAALRGAQALTGELVAPLTAGRLRGHSVVVFALPGAASLAARTSRDLEAAGATVTGTVDILAAYLDPAKARSPLEDLSLHLIPPGVHFRNGSTPIERVGTVLARATVSRQASGAVEQPSAELISGLTELHALRLTGAPGTHADLAVVVLAGGRSHQSVDRRRGADDALVGLVRSLDAAAAGVVVSGPTTATEPGGFLDILRTTRLAGVSTVDGAGTAAGTIAVVLGLVEQNAGGAGDYGVGPGAERVLPRGLTGG